MGLAGVAKMFLADLIEAGIFCARCTVAFCAAVALRASRPSTDFTQPLRPDDVRAAQEEHHHEAQLEFEIRVHQLSQEFVLWQSEHWPGGCSSGGV